MLILWHVYSREVFDLKFLHLKLTINVKSKNNFFITMSCLKIQDNQRTPISNNLFNKLV